MGKLHIQEYEHLARDPSGLLVPVGQEPALASQVVTTGANSAQSAPLQSSTRFVRLVASDDVHIVFGDNPEATTSDMALESSQAEYFGVRPRQGIKIAVIEGVL